MPGRRPLLMCSVIVPRGLMCISLSGGLGRSLAVLRPPRSWRQITPTVPGWWEILIQHDQIDGEAGPRPRDRVLMLFCHGGVYTYTPAVDGEAERFEARPWTGRELISATAEQVQRFVDSRIDIDMNRMVWYAGEMPFLGGARPMLTSSVADRRVSLS